MSALGLGRVKTPTPAARRNIFDKLRVIRTDNTADIRLDAMLENYIFYISRMYEVSHSLGQKRTNHAGPKSTFVRSCPKADKRGRNWIVRYVPIADIAGFILSLRALRKHSGPRLLARDA